MRGSRSATSRGTGTGRTRICRPVSRSSAASDRRSGWRNHGTAVLGEMISIPYVRGTVGISHGAKAVVHSAIINGVFNTAGAITNARPS